MYNQSNAEAEKHQLNYSYLTYINSKQKGNKFRNKAANTSNLVKIKNMIWEFMVPEKLDQVKLFDCCQTS